MLDMNQDILDTLGLMEIMEMLVDCSSWSAECVNCLIKSLPDDPQVTVGGAQVQRRLLALRSRGPRFGAVRYK